MDRKIEYRNCEDNEVTVGFVDMDQILQEDSDKALSLEEQEKLLMELGNEPQSNSLISDFPNSKSEVKDLGMDSVVQFGGHCEVGRQRHSRRIGLSR